MAGTISRLGYVGQILYCRLYYTVLYCTVPVLQVEAAGHPGLVGQALPGKLRPEVEEGPAGVLREVGLGPVLEAVEVLHLHRPGQVNQAGVHVLLTVQYSTVRTLSYRTLQNLQYKDIYQFAPIFCQKDVKSIQFLKLNSQKSQFLTKYSTLTRALFEALKELKSESAKV